MTNQKTHRRKRHLGKKILGGILIFFALIMLIGQATFLSKIFGFIAFGLPGLWLLLHARRESNGAAPMKKHWGIIIPLAFAALVGAVAATPTQTSNPNSTTTSTTPSTTTSTSKTSKSTIKPSDESKEATPAETTPETTSPAEPAPQDTPAAEEKTIESCGDPAIHERGTTFFTDGTTGWTQQCSDEMAPSTPQQFIAPPADNEPAAPAAPANPVAPVGGSGLSCKQVGHKTYIGDSMYDPDQDGDKDGVGCESYPG